MSDTYRPLPDSLTISNSDIDGIGLFAVKDILPGTILGISHVRDDRFPDGYIRTPLGGFFNHSDSPNCSAYIDGDYIMLKSLEHISSGEELTVKYWLYKLP